jgi:hypothetical protein
MRKVEISCMSCWSNHTCTRTWHLHKQVYTFFWGGGGGVLFFHLLNFNLHWSTHYSWSKYQIRCWTNLMAPHSRDIMPLEFFPWSFMKDYILQKFYGWHRNSSGKDIQRNLKCGKRSVDLYRADWTLGFMWSESLGFLMLRLNKAHVRILS